MKKFFSLTIIALCLVLPISATAAPQEAPTSWLAQLISMDWLYDLFAIDLESGGERIFYAADDGRGSPDGNG